MAEQYSNLEVAPNEHTTQAPELHDYADHSANAPEAVVPNASPEFDEKKAKLAHVSEDLFATENCSLTDLAVALQCFL